MATSSQKYEVRWGILATGWIAEKFAKDLLLSASNPLADHSIVHSITAAASSTSVLRAHEFLHSLTLTSAARAYGSYAELVSDPDVDIIYVASPHSHHYQHVRMALQGGKHVLCEKAFTVNAPQARILTDLARGQGLFLMEAVWTRFFPLSIEIRAVIERGDVGRVFRVQADNSSQMDISDDKRWGKGSRLVNPKLAGGALLDSGVYSLTWCFQTLYHTLPVLERKPPNKVFGVVQRYPVTGVDEMTSVVLGFERGPGKDDEDVGEGHGAHGIAMTGFRVASDPDGRGSAGPWIRLQGTKAEVQILGPAYRPEGYRVIHKSGEVQEKRFQIPVGHGLFFEADEVGRCLRDGKLESEGMGWEESLVVMEVMDEVRRQNGIEYPAEIESLDYPLQI